MPRPIDREAILQRHWRLFVRDALDAPHEAFAFDRAKATGRFTHARERATGVRKGTPDTLLCVAGFPNIWCEWKRPGYSPPPSDETFAEQRRVGDALMAIGHWWTWCNSIEVYAAWLASIGVPMRAGWQVTALQHQASALGTIARAEGKGGKPPKSYKPPAKKVSPARMRQLQDVRARTRH